MKTSRGAAAKPPRRKAERTQMKYYTIMHGTTGDYKVEYKSEKKANAAAKNIRGLGYACDVIKETERKKNA